MFKKRYYRNHIILSLCRQVLLSGNAQSEYGTAGEMYETTMLLEN